MQYPCGRFEVPKGPRAQGLTIGLIAALPTLGLAQELGGEGSLSSEAPGPMDSGAAVESWDKPCEVVSTCELISSACPTSPPLLSGARGRAGAHRDHDAMDVRRCGPLRAAHRLYD